MNNYNFDFHMKQEDIISSIIEGRLVPRDLSEFPEAEKLSGLSFIYLDNNGTPERLSLEDLKKETIEIVDSVPKNAMIGQVIFNNGVLQKQVAENKWVDILPVTLAENVKFDDSDLDVVLRKVLKDLEHIEVGSVKSVNDMAGDIIITGENNIKVYAEDGKVRLDGANLAPKTEIRDIRTTLEGHLVDFANPHNVTKEHVGLGFVDNTADIDKPVSNAQAIINAGLTAADESLHNEISSRALELDTKIESEKTTLSTRIDREVNTLNAKDVAQDVRITEVDDKIDTEIAGLRSELSSDIATIKSELDVDIAELRAKDTTLEEEDDKLHNLIDELSDDVYHKDKIQKIALSGNAEDVVTQDISTSKGVITGGDLQNTLIQIVNAIQSGGVENVINVVKQETPEVGYAATYYVTQGGVRVGELINIPNATVAENAEKIQLHKDENGVLSASVVGHSLSANDLREDINSTLAKVEPAEQAIETLKTSKQDKLIAGENIEIEDKVITAIIPEIDITNKTPAAITVIKAVGGYKEGDVIEAGTSLLDIIKNILAPNIPVVAGKLYWGYDDPTTIPSSIEGLTEVDIDESDLKANGIDLQMAPVSQRKVIAFPKTVGELVHIYQNDMTMFDLLEDFHKSEILVGETAYFLYYSDRDLDRDGSKYSFKWN